MSERYVAAARVDDVPAEGFKVVTLEGHAVVLVRHSDRIYALDNRCPHMGFPLHRGSLHNGILTCEWHHARFDLGSGGTFDLFADDARAFPVDIREGEVWVDVGPRPDMRPYYRRRLTDGLEHGVSLVLAKSAIALLDDGDDPAHAFAIGLEFGARYRERGWSQGLTMHTCFANLQPFLDADDRPRALYHGLAAVRADVSGQPARFEVGPLPDASVEPARLKRWFRDFVEVRDADGAERCLVTAIRSGADQSFVADMLFSAATDHRFISDGHVVDFTNKAFEALDVVGWEHAEPVLTSLVQGYVRARRSEESLEWRHPVDVVALLERSFDEIEPALDKGAARRGAWQGADAIVPILLGTDPVAGAGALIEALVEGAAPVQLAAVVAYAAALRIARFPTSNEFTDWDTALHTFSFAHAVHQGVLRSTSTDPVRGVLDAAMSVYLDRFLNAPAVSLPDPDDTVADTSALLGELTELLDRQQQVNAAGRTVALYLQSGGDPDRLLATLGRLLLREDRDFHTIQTMEAAFKEYSRLRGRPEGAHVLVAAARYLAAHSPTVRAQGQTFRIAQRLHRGENVYSDEESVASL